jgi:Dolichyl-phosphate-mannose-protein mannosyltransferase
LPLSAPPKPAPPAPVAAWEAALALGLAALFALLALSAAAGSSATYDEPTHLAAGYSYWRFGDFRLNPEHPPLVKLLAALPLLAQDPWPSASEGSRSRAELERTWELAPRQIDAQWIFAHELFYGVSDAGLARLGAARSADVDPLEPPAPADRLHDPTAVFHAARVPMVALALLLLAAVFAWARELWGAGGALLALALAAFDPNLLAHAPLVTTDVGLTLFAFAAVYFLWRTRRRPSLGNALGLLASVALAFVTKDSAIVFAPILVLLALVPRGAGKSGGGARPLRLLALVALAGLAAWVGVWAIYGFRYAALASGQGGELLDLDAKLRRTAAFQELIDRWPDGPPDSEVARVAPTVDLGLAGRTIAAASAHRLLPEAYLYGLAYARLQAQARWSFLRGERSLLGFRTFFPWAFLLKTPLVTLLALAAALIAAAWGERRGHPWPRAALVFLLLPAVAYFAVSVASRLNIGQRHLLPVYPFLYVLCGGLVPTVRWRGKRVRALAGVAVVAVGSSLVFFPPWRPTLVYPHYLAYFNEIAGGPRYGYRSLADSNLDWGQDLGRLARWLDAHGVREPIDLCYFGMADPRAYGIRHVKLPGGYLLEPPRGAGETFDRAIRPAYLAISATAYDGVYMSPELHAAWRRFLAGAERVGTVGHSIFIYRLE